MERTVGDSESILNLAACVPFFVTTPVNTSFPSLTVATSITQYLEAVRQGQSGASEELFEVVYSSLRQIAANRLGREKTTLQPTELVHEAWIRLGGNDATDWENRFHFFAAAAEAMRRTLIDNARRQQSAKRGGPNARRVSLQEIENVALPLADDLLDLDEALKAFEQVDSVKSQVVKLKYFAGMTIAEIAEMMNLSAASVERYWAYAKAWLFSYMSDED